MSVLKRNQKSLPIAEDLYVVQGKPAKDIAEALKIRVETVYRWIKDGDWAKKREMHNNVFRNTLITLENKLDQVSGDLGKLNLADEEFASKCDAISKLLGQIVKLRNHYEQDKLKMTVDIMGEFAIYVRKLELPEDKVEAVEMCMDGFFKEMRKKSA